MVEEFECSTKALGKLEREFLPDDFEEEEDEYDALNDETFGGESIDADWEENHDKYAKMLVDMVVNEEGSSHSENIEYSSFFDLSACDDEAEDDIISEKISQLGLKDDMHEPLLKTISQCHNIWKDESGTHSSPFPPPPGILDPHRCGSPAKPSIWNTDYSLSSSGPQDGVAFMLQSVSESSNMYHRSATHSQSSDEVSNVRKAWTVDELEKKLLSSPTKTEPSMKEWTDASIETSKSKGFGFEGIKELMKLQNSTKNTDILTSLPRIQPGAKTLDEIEKDLLNQQSSVDQGITKQSKPTSFFDNLGTNGIKEWSYDQRPGFQQRIPLPPNRMYAPIIRPTYPVLPPRLPGNHHVPVPIFSQDPRFRGVSEKPARPPSFLHPTSIMDPFRMNLAFLRPNGNLVKHPLLQEWLWREKVAKSMQSFAESRGPEWIQYQQANFSSDYDDYSGLMTKQEKDWLLRIQLMLVQTDDPHVGDFYYSTFITEKYARELAAKGKTDSQSTPKLLLPERVKTETKTYVPTQFEGSLGKLQAVNVNFPRKLLGVAVKRPAEEEEEADKEVHGINSRNYKKHRHLLLSIEKLYKHLLEIADEEKRILALPEDAHKLHRENITQHTDKLFTGLGCESNTDTFQSLMSIRKGRALGIRCFKIFSHTQRISFLKALFQFLPLITRKDQHDAILLKNINLILDFIKTLCLSDLVLLLSSLEDPSCELTSGITRDKCNLSVAFKNGFGSSIICCILERAESIYASGEETNSKIRSRWEKLVLNVFDVICDVPDLCFVSPSVCLCNHFQRFPVDIDKFEVLKDKLNALSSNIKELNNA